MFPVTVTRMAAAIYKNPHSRKSSLTRTLQVAQANSMALFDFYLDASLVLLTLYFYLKRRSSYSLLPLPPGPKKWPIIGNLMDMPTEVEWKTYHRWSKELDTDILHVSVMGTDIIVLDTAEAAFELFERRSSIYSDRPRMPMINELMKWSFNVGFMQYGDNWRRHRRLMHQHLHPAAARQLRPHALKATHHLLQRILDEPHTRVLEHLRYLAGETIMSIAYGLDIKPKDDPYIQIAEQGVHALGIAAVPGTFLVDILPILKYVPEWVPGAGFKKKAREWAKLAMMMVDMPFEAAKKEFAEGKATPSLTSLSFLKAEEGSKDDAFEECVIRGSAGTLYAAGTDSTVAAIASCTLALLENPDVLEKAQAELDSVIKPGHLPSFEDNEDNLPYITAITLEALRWRDVAPIAIPRYLQVDDEYKGYRLPKGSIVIANAWAMLHNEHVYPDPFAFRPERFLTEDGKSLDKTVRDPRHACFGFGRRICPARFMAFSAVWIALASIMYCFDIKKEADEDGNVVELTHDYDSALIVCVESLARVT
ncbi:hypothetical protein D9756_009447 [Leucocoprinus leucothites]|uniref:Cytochrome P450 n=1 Tax=Leucocoprinus leucothites TaxID=201217 RepID=A0A8H5FU10_9AGAR|nr:hypothetical protein D9756_009447 [Leucoagaricus leucothites]